LILKNNGNDFLFQGLLIKNNFNYYYVTWKFFYDIKKHVTKKKIKAYSYRLTVTCYFRYLILQNTIHFNGIL